MKYLKIKTLEKGYRDPDELLLHAAFQCLVDFFNEETNCGFGRDWNYNDEHKKAWKEIKELHTWWTKKRPARKDPLDKKGLKIPPLEFKDVPGKPHLKEMVPHDPKKYKGYDNALKKYWDLEQKWDEEDDQNLHRLINVRMFLWV